MIVDDHRSWLQLIFSLRGSSVTHTWPRIFLATFIAVMVTWLFESGSYTVEIAQTPLTVVGLALGIFLGFRNNEAYHRYWSGRILWGRLVNVSRTFIRQLDSLVGVRARHSWTPEEQEAIAALRRQLGLHMIGYVHALRHHLRHTDPLEQVAGFVSEADLAAARAHHNRPAALCHSLGVHLRDAYVRGWINDVKMLNLDQSLTEIMAIQGGCERIQKTPLPHAYTVLIHRLTAFYCFFLPFGIVSNVHYMTPILTLLVSYALFGFDDIGEELQDPFGVEPNDLPLEALTTTIERDVKALMNEDPATIPGPPVAIDDQLI